MVLVLGFHTIRKSMDDNRTVSPSIKNKISLSLENDGNHSSNDPLDDDYNNNDHIGASWEASNTSASEKYPAEKIAS